jgi:hypothetical protein
MKTARVPLVLEEKECITGMKFEDAEVRFGTTICDRGSPRDSEIDKRTERPIDIGITTTGASLHNNDRHHYHNKQE